MMRSTTSEVGFRFHSGIVSIYRIPVDIVDVVGPGYGPVVDLAKDTQNADLVSAVRSNFLLSFLVPY